MTGWMTDDQLLALISIQGQALADARDSLRSMVASARRAGVTWDQIGRALGITRQGAQSRFGPFLDEAEEEGGGRG